MITKQQAYEYEIGNMNWFQILLSCIPYYHYVLEYQYKKRYQRYIKFYNINYK